MVGLSGTSKSGNTYYYYSCNGTRKKECHKKNVPKNKIEDIVVERCRELLTTKNIDMISTEVYSICQNENNQNTLLKCLKKRKKELESIIQNLIKAFLILIKKGNKDNIKYRKTLISIFVNRIYLYDDRLTIIFNVGSNPISVDVSLIDNITNSNNNELGLYLNKLSSP